MESNQLPRSGRSMHYRYANSANRAGNQNRTDILTLEVLCTSRCTIPANSSGGG